MGKHLPKIHVRGGGTAGGMLKVSGSMITGAMGSGDQIGVVSG